MNPLDGHDVVAATRRRELERAAARHRVARGCRPARTGPSPLLRLYARLWWASRPRVGAWGAPPLPSRAAVP
ncbi:hypothetical protein [Pseudonocardia humida]|uniref:Uncharacterized protein n=1 Tax=Pseudonocardia humida TaxID=2800819 RepID=A0ABT1AB67_9PSEU|nr:hypothetical protein [Pseudonocardia humida]MCO1660170.1 hypothetical protein [Pseudonocardia humida]